VPTPLLHLVTPNHNLEKKIPSRASRLFLAPLYLFSDLGPFFLLPFSIPLLSTTFSFFFFSSSTSLLSPQDPRFLVNTAKMSAPNDNEHEMTFDSADAGASLTFPMQCSALRKNGFVVIKNRPCKIIDMSTSKTGKHGHAKVHLVATDIFTGKKYEDLSPSTHNMDVPNVSRREYQLLDISDDGFLSLMTDDGDTKDDVPLPDNEVGQKITKLFKEEEKDTNVIVLTSMGEECAMEAKEAPNQG
jgi:translation initiation factor 5A